MKTAKRKPPRAAATSCSGKLRNSTRATMGVPEGATFWSYVFVIWGYDNEAKQGFIYGKGNPETAAYTITGTTLSNTLGLIAPS